MNTKNHSVRSLAPKKTLRCVLTALVATSLLLPVTPQAAYAEPGDTSAEVQAQAREVSAQLATTEAEMQVLRDNYIAAVEAQDQALAGMEAAQERIDAAEALITETQERLGNRANQMYRQGPLTYFDVLLGASSFEEFATGWELLSIINKENAELIQASKDARAEAEAAHEEYAAQESAAAERKAEAEAVMLEAEELAAEQQAILSGLEAEVAELVQIERLDAEAEANRQNPANPALPNNPVTPGNPTNPEVPDVPSNPDPVYVPPAPPPGGYSDVVAAAASSEGCPYVWGASGPNDFDCSGLTSWSYLQAGRGWIGRTDYEQKARALASWPYTEGGAAPGDVLWWPGHVAIYVGGGTYIHAANPSLGVLYSSWDINSALVLRF